MALTPRPLARRLDQASRAAHRFHRFAHHPLCSRYADEVIALGHRTRVCRGCASVVVGTLCGLLLGGMLRLGLAAGAFVLVAAALLAVGRVRRLPKVVSRFAPAVALGLALASGVGPALAAIAFAVGATLVYRRGGPYRGPCVTCPERTAEMCSGIAPMVRRERAFRRLAQRWLDRANLYPRAGKLSALPQTATDRTGPPC